MESSNKCCKETSCSGFTCPITGFNFFFNKKLLIASIIMIVWSNLFAWIWHGNVMKEAYSQTASLWRPEQEMILSSLNGGMILIGFIASYIFLKGYEGKGIKEGIRFGVLMGLLFFGVGLITHATQPVPFSIIAMWALGDFISYSIGAILIGFTCGRCSKVKNESCCS